MREIRMTIPQFKAYRNGEISIRDIKRVNQMESMASHILNNPRLTRMFTVAIAGINTTTVAMADVNNSMGKIDAAGSMFLSIFQQMAYWLCLIACIIEILKSLLNSNTKDIGRTMMKYLLMFASVFLMPFAFNLIRDIFK